jgi:hypothetical protein
MSERNIMWNDDLKLRLIKVSTAATINGDYLEVTVLLMQTAPTRHGHCTLACLELGNMQCVAYTQPAGG